MLAAARRHHVGLMPVLSDFHMCGAPKIVNGVPLGGRSRLIADRDAGTAFIDQVLRPIVEHCGGDEAVIAWDVFNEPCPGRRRGASENGPYVASRPR